MKSLLCTTLLLAAGVAVTATAIAEPVAHIPIQTRGSSTFYVDGHIEGAGAMQLLVDTGSGYTTINEDTLAVLKSKGQATFVKQLRGVMADGSKRIVSVYRIASITIGGNCVVRNVEAAIFPAGTRAILGLNTLRQVSPFTFSVDPPHLALSNCKQDHGDIRKVNEPVVARVPPVPS